MGKATLDGIPEAICVFSQEGGLEMSNDAYAGLWRTEPREVPAQMTFRETVDFWEDLTEATLVWDALRAYVSQRHA